MSILETSLSLDEIEQLLEAELNKEDNIEIIGDLDLSFEDYNYLMLKLKTITNSKNSIALIAKYKLSIITAWVFSLKYGEAGRSDRFGIRELLAKMPQHQLRHSLNIFASTLDEYGFVDSTINMESMDGLLSTLEINSGITEEKQVI